MSSSVTPINTKFGNQSNGIDNPLFQDNTHSYGSMDTIQNTNSIQNGGVGSQNLQGRVTSIQKDVKIDFEDSVGELDPLGLKAWKKTEEELNQLQSTKSLKKLRNFYIDQNNTIDELLAPVNSLDPNELRKQNLKLHVAIYGTLAANLILFGLQLAATIFSGSLALFATMADAFMDSLSSIILVIANYLSGQAEIYNYPSGKSRFETVGIVIFGTLMSTLSLLLIFQAIDSIVNTPTTPDLGLISITFVGISLGIKICLFLYCRVLDHPAAQVLAQDHRNDLFSNSLGLGLAVLGAKVNPFLDPIGAIIVALIILRSWASTVVEYSRLIVGKCADPNFLKRITYISMTHDDRILKLDTCRAYYSGSKVIVEVDIVLPPEMKLELTHDVGESLQMKLESLPTVERAFVHCDYETTHKPEHRKSH